MKRVNKLKKLLIRYAASLIWLTLESCVLDNREKMHSSPENNWRNNLTQVLEFFKGTVPWDLEICCSFLFNGTVPCDLEICCSFLFNGTVPWDLEVCTLFLLMRQSREIWRCAVHFFLKRQSCEIRWPAFFLFKGTVPWDLEICCSFLFKEAVPWGLEVCLFSFLKGQSRKIWSSAVHFFLKRQVSVADSFHYNS